MHEGGCAMQDYQKHLEKLRADAAECRLICDLATDPKKRETFDRLLAVFDRQAGRAAFASSMARRVSNVPMFGTVPITAPVAEFSTFVVFPDLACIHSPRLGKRCAAVAILQTFS